jgi:hypothetical protein
LGFLRANSVTFGVNPACVYLGFLLGGFWAMIAIKAFSRVSFVMKSF